MRKSTFVFAVAFFVTISFLAVVNEANAGCNDGDIASCTIGDKEGTKECFNGRWSPCMIKHEVPTPTPPPPTPTPPPPTPTPPPPTPAGYALLATEDNARGLGDTPVSFSVSDGGEATISVPLWVPPGRAGIQPALALSYSSRADNGPLGVGWQLAGESRITRCRRTLAQDGTASPVKFASDDAFCLDGRRLVAIGPASATGTHSRQEFRLELDPATRILMYSDSQGPLYFEVYHPDRRISVYGAPLSTSVANARLEGKRATVQTLSNGTDAVIVLHTDVRYAWALWEERDRSGNYLRWTYTLSSAVGPDGEIHYEQLPAEIQYTGFSSSGTGAIPNRKVTFAYEARPDVDFRFVSGFGLKSTLRLKEMVMSGPGLNDPAISQNSSPLRMYKLRYDTPSVSGRSLLHSIEECDGSSVCRVPVKFRWELGCGIGTQFYPEQIGTGCSKYSDANANEFEDIDLGLNDVMKYSPLDPADPFVWQNFPEIADFWTLQTADINGDGRDDLLYRVPQLNRSRTYIIKVEWFYRLSTGRGFGPAEKAFLPESKTGAGIEDLRTVDLNGDGKVEIISVINADPRMGTNGSYEVFEFDGSQFQPAGISASETFQGWWKATEPLQFPLMHVADLNGDGRPELVRSTMLVDPYNPPNPQPYRWGYRSNTTTGPLQLGGYAALGVTSGIDHAAYTVDWDNDGSVNLLVRDAVPLGAGDFFSSQLFALSVDAQGQVVKTPTALSGLPFELSDQLTSMSALGRPSYTYFRTWFVDINGDGLPDAVDVREHRKVAFPDTYYLSTLAGHPFVAINTGNGFKSYESKAIAPSGEISPIFEPYNGELYNGRNVDVGVRMLDYNSDGKLDLLVADSGSRLSGGRRRSKLVVLESNGSGFDARPLSIPVGDSTMLSENFGSGYPQGNGQRMVQVLDANGDGLTDIVQVVGGRLHLYLRKGKQPDVILGIDRRLESPGIDITYEPIGGNPQVYTAGTCAYPQQCVTQGLWVVSQHSVDDGLGGQNTWRYSYAQGRLDLRGRGWLGFSQTTVTDQQTGAVLTTIRDNVTTAKVDPNDAAYLYPFADRVASEVYTVKVDSLSSSPTHRRTLQAIYKAVPDSSGTTLFAYPEITSLKEEEGRSSPLPILRETRVSLQVVDGYGNVIHTVQETDDAPGQTGSPVHRLETQTEYTNDTSLWLIGLAKTVATTSTVPGGQSARHEWEYGYYPATGLLALEEAAPAHRSDPIGPDTSDLNEGAQYVRDSYGLVTSVQRWGGGSGEASIAYDSIDHTFPRTLTNDAGHVTELFFHAGLGEVATEVDPNGLRTIYRYDGYGRIRAIDYPDAADVSIRYTSGYSGRDQPGQAIIKEVAQSDQPWRSNPIERIVYDSLGRPARYEKTAFGGGTAIIDTFYDRLGRVSIVSVPYMSNLQSASYPPPMGYTAYRFDQLGRATQTTRPSGLGPTGPSRSTEYEGLITRNWDEAGNLHYTVTDGLGRLARSVDVEPGGREIVTKYSYGPFNTLETVTDPNGNQTSIKYDERGRQYMITDPDRGMEQIYYLGSGSPKKIVNGNGQAATYQYDRLERLISKTDPSGTTDFRWDDTPNGIGKLHWALGPDGINKYYQYDAYGRLEFETWTFGGVGGQNYTLKRDYDAYGRLELLTYPKPYPRVRYVYNDQGYVSEIREQARVRSTGRCIGRSIPATLPAPSRWKRLATMGRPDAPTMLRTV